MEEGSLRVDANISVRPPGQTKLGTKTEVKNMNSFSAVERALEAEFERQCALLDSGGRVEQQTLLWDGARETVRPSRTKEGSHDYRYFPEPDLLPLKVDEKWISDARSHLPELPEVRKMRFIQQYGITGTGSMAVPAPSFAGNGISATEVEQVTATPELAEYFEEVAGASGDAKAAYNWVMGEVLAALRASRRRHRALPGPAGGSGAASQSRTRRHHKSHRGKARLRADGGNRQAAGASWRPTKGYCRSAMKMRSRRGWTKFCESTRKRPRATSPARKSSRGYWSAS